MAPLRRVAGDQAGPSALGILIPPGRRTFVILRPRALEWDLLPLKERPSGQPPAFRDVGRHEAPRLAEGLYDALGTWVGGGPGEVKIVGLPGDTHGVLVELGKQALLACPREPGKPYRPLACPGVEEARAIATALTAALRPASGTELEVYFNTQNFSR